jgi:hypothetical protein
MTDDDPDTRPDRGGRPRRPDETGRLHQPEPPSRFWYLFRFINDHFTGIVLLGALLVGSLALWGRVTISRNMIVAAFFFVASAPLAFVTARSAVNWLFEQSYVYGVELKIEDEESGGIYSWTVAEFRELEIEEDLDYVHPSLFFAREIHYDEGRVVGSWRGRLTDRELATALENIRIWKDNMTEDARRGFRLDSSLGPILDVAARKGHEELLEFYREGTLPDDGDALHETLDDIMADVESTQIPEDVERDDREDLPDELPGAEEFEWVGQDGETQ